MLVSLTLVPLGIVTALLAFPVGAHADGGQIIERTTGTKFEEIIQVEGQSFRCLGAGVRKLMTANVYAVAFYVEAEHADALVKSYIEDHHAELRDDPLFGALRKDSNFFGTLAGTKRNRLAMLKMRRDLSKKQLASNIRRSLGALLPDEKLDKLTAAITAGAKKGEIVKIYAVGSRLTVDVAGAVRVIDDEEVTRNLFFVWLGPKSVSPTLRDDIARRAARPPR